MIPNDFAAVRKVLIDGRKRQALSHRKFQVGGIIGGDLFGAGQVLRVGEGMATGFLIHGYRQFGQEAHPGDGFRLRRAFPAFPDNKGVSYF